jgi:hypothetical protein
MFPTGEVGCTSAGLIKQLSTMLTQRRSRRQRVASKSSKGFEPKLKVPTSCKVSAFNWQLKPAVP